MYESDVTGDDDMKRKIINGVVDILFIMIVFSVTDWITLHIFNTDKWWMELLTYLVIYAALAAVRWLIRRAWCQLIRKSTNETEKE